jgi:hypothetical protein
MMHADDSVAVEGIKRFLKLHATCGRLSLDIPELPGGTGYRALAACLCGDTVEYWLTSFPHALLDSDRPDPTRSSRAA